MSAIPTTTVRMTQTKITPGTVRFDAPAPADGSKALCGNVYVQKEAFPDGKFPAAIEVTIKAL